MPALRHLAIKLNPAELAPQPEPGPYSRAGNESYKPGDNLLDCAGHEQ